MTACIVGWAHTPFGKHDAETVEGLIIRVAREALDQTLLHAALQAHEGHRQNAAQALGVGRNTLTRKLGDI